jgi:hypothetical protein
MSSKAGQALTSVFQVAKPCCMLVHVRMQLSNIMLECSSPPHLAWTTTFEAPDEEMGICRGERLMRLIIVQATKCGDEVENGKPAPDCFRATAVKMGVAPEQCLVIEDAPSGVEAAAAAGMRVVVVPSLRDVDAHPKPDPSCSAGSERGAPIL